MAKLFRSDFATPAAIIVASLLVAGAMVSTSRTVTAAPAALQPARAAGCGA
ncbi:MAG TPA: hypothetical protein VJJ47_03025 [Candidatus Paceibacterota bacterium]